jgi:hypothetical protein
MSDLDGSVARLKAKYAYGSLYLTYIPLYDMTNLLNEEKKFAKLASESGQQGALQVLKAFLDGKRERQINEALAFVQLNLECGKAGYKRISDRDGAISPIPWSETEVWRIAIFSDAFLNRLLAFEEKQASISALEVSLGKAWEAVKDFAEDPYIPAIRTAELVRDFKFLVAERPGELESLQSVSRETHVAIQRFATAYDQYLAPLARDATLELIRLKDVEMSQAFQKVIHGYENRPAMLRTKKVQNSLRKMRDSLRGAAGSFKAVDFLGSMERTDDESFIEIFRHLTAGSEEPGQVTMQPMRQMIVGSEKRHVDVIGFSEGGRKRGGVLRPDR